MPTKECKRGAHLPFIICYTGPVQPTVTFPATSWYSGLLRMLISALAIHNKGPGLEG